MCGRFVIATPLTSIFEYFEIQDPRVAEQPPRYNVAPTTPILIVRDDGESRSLDSAFWGFIPSWAKSLDDARKPINARSESVADSKLFGRAYKQRRCLIPADGFYEWQARTGSQRKQPSFIHRQDGQLLALGGIWETWHEGDDDVLTSAAILTTAANDAVSELHNRMPLILEQADWDEWLLGDDPADLLQPADDNILTWHPVDPAVGNTRNDDPHLIEPIDES